MVNTTGDLESTQESSSCLLRQSPVTPATPVQESPSGLTLPAINGPVVEVRMRHDMRFSLKEWKGWDNVGYVIWNNREELQRQRRAFISLSEMGGHHKLSEDFRVNCSTQNSWRVYKNVQDGMRLVANACERSSGANGLWRVWRALLKNIRIKCAMVMRLN